MTHVLVQVPPQILGHVGPAVSVINCRETSISRQEELVFHVWPVSLYLRIVMTHDTQPVIKNSNAKKKSGRYFRHTVYQQPSKISIFPRHFSKKQYDSFFNYIDSRPKYRYFPDISPKKNENLFFFDVLPILYDIIVFIATSSENTINIILIDMIRIMTVKYHRTAIFHEHQVDRVRSPDYMVSVKELPYC